MIKTLTGFTQKEHNAKKGLKFVSAFSITCLERDGFSVNEEIKNRWPRTQQFHKEADICPLTHCFTRLSGYWVKAAFAATQHVQLLADVCGVFRHRYFCES